MSNLKRFLALTLAMLMVVGAMVTVSAKSFTDVAADDAYAEAVDVLSELGVVVGATETEFNPETLVERQQMAMFIARLATAQPGLFAVEAGPVFKDQTAPVYNAAIQYTYTNNIIAGRTATTFDGAATVTLQEAATMLARALGYGNKANNISYPYSYMVIANEIGLLKGLEDVAPTAALTRGEVAIMLFNALFAPKADRELLYTPDGQDFVVTIPDEFTDNDSATAYETLATKAWKCTVVDGAFINATLKAGIDRAPTAATKAISDPVAFNKGVAGNISFATLGKYFEEDVTADDMLGVELQVITRNSTILKIDVVGSKSVTTDASYNKDTDALTVDGTSYNLAAYLTETYPADSDNCFYTFNGSNRINRITADVDTAYAQIANGFFTFDVINEGLSTQMLVFKPQSFAQLTDANADGVLELGGKNVTSNAVSAVKDEFVTYVYGGDKNVDVVAKAVKTSGKVKTVNLTSNTATLEDGTVAPAIAGTPITGASLIALSIGNTYDIYAVDGVVLKTTLTITNTQYAPKTYYTITDTAAKITDGFGFKFNIKYVNAAGTESVLAITHVDGTEITATNWDAAGYFTTLKGKIITIDGTNVYTSALVGGQLTDQFSSDKANDTAIGPVAVDLNVNGTLLTLDDNNVATADVSTVLTDYSKIVVFAANTAAPGAGKTSGYVAFSGKTFKGLDTVTNAVAVYHKNEVGINELAYLFAQTTISKEEVQNASTVIPAANLYLFLSVDSFDATTVTFNAIKLSTGTVEKVTYTNAAAGAGGSTAILNSVNYGTANALLGKASAIFNVQSEAIPVQATNAEVQIRRSATGYISANGTFATNGTKYYQWNATTNTYDVKTTSDVVVGNYYNGLVAVNTLNANADFVVIRSATTTANPVITPAASTVEAGRDLITITSGSDVYYTTDGTEPTTASTKYTAPFTLTGTAGSKVTVKAIAVSAATGTSAVASVEYTIGVTARVAAPIATQTGNVAKSTSVMIGTETAGAVLIYSVDGGTTWTTAPSNSATITFGALGVPNAGKVTIKAYAIKFGMTTSDTVTFEYGVGSQVATLTSIDALPITVTSTDKDGLTTATAKTATIATASGTIDATALVASAGATATAFTTPDYSTTPATATWVTTGTLYVKVVSESGLVTVYYQVTVVAP